MHIVVSVAACRLISHDHAPIGKSFICHVDETTSTAELKEKVKAKNPNDLANIDAADLRVWRCLKPSTRFDGPDSDVAKQVDAVFSNSQVKEVDLDEKIPYHTFIGTLLVQIPDPTQFISLNCLILQSKWFLSSIFTVRIRSRENVSILKDLIGEKQVDRLNHVDPSDLILHQVSLPVNDGLKESLKNVALAPLDPLLPLSQLFPLAEHDHLHIIVQVPITEGPDIEGPDSGERNNIPALYQRYKNVISSILKSPAPSNSAKPAGSRTAYFICDGRYNPNKPRCGPAPPVQLFHPIFGHFLDSVKSDDALPDDIICQTVEFMRSASAIYESESERRRELAPELYAVLGFNIFLDIINAHGVAQAVINRIPVLHFLEENVNGYLFGNGLSNSSTEAGLSTTQCWAQSKYKRTRDATNCPTFLIATAGPKIAIFGYVFTDVVVVQPLTNLISVCFDNVVNTSHIVDVARTFYALKTSLERLGSYHKSLKPLGKRPVDSRYFPSITAYRSNAGERVEFRYVGCLTNDASCITFRARTTTMPTQDIVIKFADRYGESAHQKLAEVELAPKLLYHGSPHLDNNDPSYESISMIVMEYIDGDTFAVAKPKMPEESKKAVQSEVRRALKVLHGQGLVFGGLRPSNVMITKDGHVKLVGFDCAGEEGQARFPVMSSGIDWPEGVRMLNVIKREHDLEMLSKLI